MVGFVRQKLSCNFSASWALRTAYWFVGLQALFIIIIAAGWWVRGITEALSVLLGGGACVIPNFLFSRCFFATMNTTQTVKQILANFYIGELIKLVLNTGLVLLIVLFIPVSLAPLIIGFIGAQFGFWLSPLLIKLVIGRDVRTR